MTENSKEQNPNPQDQNYYVYLIGEDIYGSPFDSSVLPDIVKSLPLIRALAEVAQLNYILEVQGEIDLSTHEQILSRLLDQKSSDRIISFMRNKNRIFVSRNHLWILMKYIVLHADREHPEVPLTTENRKALFDAIVAISDLIGEESKKVINELPREDKLTETVYELFATSYLSKRPHLIESLVRARYMFVNLHKYYDDKDKPSSYTDIENVFKEETGISIDHYFSMGIMLLAPHFENILSKKVKVSEEYNIVLNQKIYLSQETGIDSKIVNLFFDITSIDLDEFTDFIRTQNVRQIAYDFIKLLLNPYVNVKPDLSILTSIANLVEMLTTNIYWKIFNYLNSKGKGEHLTFSSYFGWLLQDYIIHLLRIIINPYRDGITEIVDQEYKVGKNKKRSPDIILMNEEMIILFEVSSTRFQAKRTLAEGERQSLESDFKKMVFHNLTSLSNFIDDVRNGNVPFLDNKTIAEKTIVPVVVNVDGLFMSSHVYDYIMQSSKTRNLLQQDGISKPVFISPLDIETMDSVDGNIFTDIREWLASTGFPNEPFASFLASKYHLQKNRSADDWRELIFKEMLNDAAKLVFPMRQEDAD